MIISNGEHQRGESKWRLLYLGIEDCVVLPSLEALVKSVHGLGA